MDAEYRRQLRRRAPEEKDRADTLSRRIGNYRQMVNVFRGKTFYTSTFFPDTGTLIRACEDFSPLTSARWSNYALHLCNPDLTMSGAQCEAVRQEWQEKYSWDRNSAFSPVPETIDVAINSYCNFGCTYCYTNATTKGTHASLDLIRAIFSGLDQAPYQIALGGGSPTQHPEFIPLLQLIRDSGSIPNYTTEGQNLTEEILSATNSLCGGVALTYHASRGFAYFRELYLRLRHRLRIQLNVHLIADKDVASHLDELTGAVSELGPINIVLLAYYPDVGRSELSRLMPKKVYPEQFPAAIQRAMGAGHQIAFSEGLIPYFLSRPEIGVDTRLLTPSEGRFSCYLDLQGRVSHSSFAPPSDSSPTLYQTRLQTLWDHLRSSQEPYGSACYDCAWARRCSVPNPHH